MLTVEAYRTDAEKLYAEVERAYVDLFAGHTDNVDFKSINAKYTHLLAPDLIPAKHQSRTYTEIGTANGGTSIRQKYSESRSSRDSRCAARWSNTSVRLTLDPL